MLYLKLQLFNISKYNKPIKKINIMNEWKKKNKKKLN